MSRLPPPRKESGPRINHQIRAPEVRFIDHTGEMQGVMHPREAQRLAEEAGLDLVEISPNANPPVVKALDYGKYKYEQAKKAAEARKKQKVVEIKELKMRPTIDKHDFETKMRHAKGFLEDGDKVKFTIRFKGRETSNADMGYNVCNKVKEALEGLMKVEQQPKMEGRQMVMIVAPVG